MQLFPVASQLQFAILWLRLQIYLARAEVEINENLLHYSIFLSEKSVSLLYYGGQEAQNNPRVGRFFWLHHRLRELSSTFFLFFGKVLVLS